MDSYLISEELFESPKYVNKKSEFSYFLNRCLGKNTPNEDALLVICLSDNSYIFAIADGAGGYPKGEEAAYICLNEIVSVFESAKVKNSYRTEILDAIEGANKKIIDLKTGAKTTLSVLEYQGGLCRSYQVGDSVSLICGQKGKLKYKSTAHSPVGYGVEAGFIGAEEALQHPDLHIISNLVGEAEMKIELGPEVVISPNDTLFLASDGLFDNLSAETVIEIIRAGSIEQATEGLYKQIESQIYNNENAKQDDLSFILFRPN